MKDNHISQVSRLERRIARLKVSLEPEWVPIGKPNPYSKCRFCGKSQPASTYEGHYKGCRAEGIRKEIKHYENLLLNAQR